MKKLAAVAVLLLCGVGCKASCNNFTIFSAGEKGCRAWCVENPHKACECNINCVCHEQKKWAKEKAASAKKDE